MALKEKIKYVLNNYRSKFNSKEIGFLEQMQKANKITTKQAKWLQALLEKAGFKYDIYYIEENYNVVESKPKTQKTQRKTKKEYCEHEDLGSLGYTHGTIVTCPHCGQRAEVW